MAAKVEGAAEKRDIEPGAAQPEPELADSAPLAQLRKKIDTARNKRVLDDPVPGLDDRIVVRFRPIQSAELTRITRERQKAPIEDQALLAACDVLATCCLGIFERDEKGELVASGDLLATSNGTPLTFATLKLASTGRAEDEVQALYGSVDGDVISTSDRIVRFSGYTTKANLAAIQGE